MNPVGVALLLLASWMAVYSAVDVRRARGRGHTLRGSLGGVIATAAVATLAAGWCAAVGVWLVVTR